MFHYVSFVLDISVDWVRVQIIHYHWRSWGLVLQAKPRFPAHSVADIFSYAIRFCDFSCFISSTINLPKYSEQLPHFHHALSLVSNFKIRWNTVNLLWLWSFISSNGWNKGRPSTAFSRLCLEDLTLDGFWKGILFLTNRLLGILLALYSLVMRLLEVDLKFSPCLCFGITMLDLVKHVIC